MDAIIHGAFGSKADKVFEHINERVHWSALRKRGRPGIVFGVQNAVYNPANLPPDIPEVEIAKITAEEEAAYGNLIA